MDYGSIIKTFRVLNNMSQQQLAELFNVNQSNISRIENSSDDLMVDLQEKILNYFQVYHVPNNKEIARCFHKIKQGTYYHFRPVVDKAYRKITTFTVVNFNDFMLIKMAEGIVYLYREDFANLFPLVDYIEAFYSILDDSFKQTFHFLKGAALQRNHLFKECYDHFLKSFELMEELKIYDGPLMVMMMTTNLYFRHLGSSFTIATRALKQTLKDHNRYRRVLIKFNMGMIYYFDGNFKEAIPLILELYHNESVLKETYFLKHQCNSLLGTSYMLLGDFKEALKYFTDSIDHPITEAFIEFTFWNTLYCFKQLNDEGHFNEYLAKFNSRAISQEEVKRAYIDTLLPFEDKLISKALFNNMPLLYKGIFSHPDKYNVNRTLFNYLFTDLWEQKHYLHYKNINELMIRLKMGSVSYEL